MDGVDERIEAFLRGMMNVEEESVFKQELKSSPVLRDRAKAMASLIKGIQVKEAEKEKHVFDSTDKARKSRMRPILMWACSIAAVFVIFFGIYKDHRYRTLEAVVSPYYSEYDLTNISRGDVDSTTIAHLYGLFAQIQENRNVTSIIKELEPIYHSLDDDFTYYPWANDIAWNLALAYIKDDQIDKAIPILEQLKQDNPDTSISIKAQELLKKIRSL